MNINIELERGFVTSLNRLKAKYGSIFAKLNGLSESQLNFNDFIDNFTEDNVALSEISINQTSNSVRKDIVSLIHGMSEPHEKLIAMRKFYYEINKKYNKKEADTWLEFIWCGILYMHDFPTATFFPYCYASSLRPIAERGLFFIDQFPTRPAKHLSTFCDHVLETISWLSNRQSGAVGVPDLLVYMYYFWDRDVKKNYLHMGEHEDSAELYARQYMQKVIYDLNQPYIRILESAFTNVTIMDREYLVGLFGGWDFPNGDPIMNHIDQLITFQKWFIEEVHKTREEHTFTFPVLTYSLLWSEEIDNFVDEEFARWASDENYYWMDSNFFFGRDITVLSSCCRLTSDLSKIKSNVPDQPEKLTGWMNSISGGALSVGSVKVSTINLRRIALMSGKDEDKYIKLLGEFAHIDLIGLDVQRGIIKRNIEKGLLPNYTSGLLDLNKQYSTIGVTGLYEALDEFGYICTDSFGNKFYTKQADEFAIRILDEINRIKDEWVATRDYSINVEAIPGESSNIKLAKMDNMLYPDCKQVYILGNQWIPLREKCTLEEKVRLGALLDSKCGGGQIMHANIEGQFANKEQAWQLLKYIARSGVIYSALNPKIKECANGHHWVGNSICPKCGGKVLEEYTRIVGFFRPESSFSKERQQEYFERTFFPAQTLEVNNQ